MRAAAPFVTILLSAIVALGGCGGPPPVVDPPPPEVLVAIAETRAVNPYVRFVGRIQAVEDAQLNARVAGYIVERTFAEGSFVAAGDVLVKLDPEEYQIAAAQAEGRLALAQAELAAAQRNFERADELMKAEAIAARDFDEAVNRRDQAKAQVATAEADLERARYDLKHTEVRAPFDGRISFAAKSIGDFVGLQEGITSLVTTDPMQVSFDVNEKELAAFMLRQKDQGERRAAIEGVEVKLILPGDLPYAHSGKIDFFDNRINPNTGSMKARAAFPNSDLVLVAGQFVTVILENEQADEAILVPQHSVQQDQLGTYLMVVDAAGVVEQRRVELGSAFGPAVAVRSGLEPGEQVVVEGLLKIRPGITVSATLQAPAESEAVALPTPEAEPATEDEPAPAADGEER